MATSRTPRRRPDAPTFAPTTLTEIARRYYACAIALAKAMGVPMTEDFLRQHRESISCCFIEAGRAGVRLPPAVHLPPLGGSPTAATNGQAPSPETSDVSEADIPDFPPPASNGDTPPLTVIPTAADLPTSIPAGLQLPCAEALIVDLRPPQLSLLIGKVGLKALADKRLEPLHVALLAERARRLAQGRTPTPVPEGAADGA